MKCKVCKINEAETGSIVCSDECNEKRLTIIELSNIFTPTNGCDNCWGDLGQGCTEECKKEFRVSGEFIKALYSLVRNI